MAAHVCASLSPHGKPTHALIFAVSIIIISLVWRVEQNTQEFSLRRVVGAAGRGSATTQVSEPGRPHEAVRAIPQ